MPNQLDVPPELQFLIEKRVKDDRRDASLEPPADAQSTGAQQPEATDASEERRNAARRAEDQQS